MKHQTRSKQNSTKSFGSCLVLLVLLASLLSSCGVVLQAPLPLETPTEMPAVILSPMPTEVAPEMPIAMVTEIPIETTIQMPTESGIFTIIPKLEGTIDSFSVDQKTYEDFFDKKIPLQGDLRIGEDNLIKEIGECELDVHEDFPTIAHLQLFMMGGFLNKDGLYLVVGTQDENGKRLVLPIQMTFEATGKNSNVMMILDGNQTKEIQLSAVGLNNISGEECLDYARQNMGKVVVIQLLLDSKGIVLPNSEYTEANEKYFIEQRMRENNINCTNPEDLEVSNYKNVPWGQLIVFSN